MNDAYISNIVDEISNAAASATSGGASAGGGQTTVTGDSSASVQVTNVINAGGEGGTSHTIIEKTVDGVREVHEETKTFAPGEPVIVNTHAEAVSGGQSAAEAGGAETSAETAEDTEGEAASTTEATPALWSFGNFVIEKISGFFSSVWSWFSN